MRFFPGVTSGGEHSDVSSLRTSVTDEARRINCVVINSRFYH